ncbi:Cell surface protein [Acidisarcina polymorpha]|uniref:Cell surface protein n=1 Tax=Acidisarcina polymorpha TaxID=2211140 RepID=A0A2Z5FSD7_9BACT|nr:SBBP repeat-containing protein [Acidisarcina polymorpha]AXC09713.1 Cell surface protein [Acidisarcina polymorpha]
MKSFLPVALSLLAMSPMVVNAQELNPSVAAANQNLAPSKLVSPMKAVPPAITAAYGKLPLSFEANRGQSDPQVKFLSRGQGYTLFLTGNAAVLTLSKDLSSQPKTSAMAGKAALQRPAKIKTDVVRMELAGAARGMQVSGADALPGKANYFFGKDSSQWHTNLPTYAKVKYSNVYPGIDLVYYGNQRQLEYDFVVAPNADPKQARLHFAGASKLKLNSGGDLEIIAKDGEIAFHKPIIYQMKDGQRQPVEGSFQLLANNTVGFTLASYDHSRELVVDPVLAYSTYLAPDASNGFGGNMLVGMTVDHAGCAYLTGYAQAFFPTTGTSFQPTRASSSQDVAFVTKINSSGTALIYSTYLGGPDVPGAAVGGGSEGNSIAVDQAGNAYVTGNTFLSYFPVTAGAFQTVNKNTSSTYFETGFVTKLNAFGSGLVYSTYLGGSAYDQPDSVIVDAEGNAYITGGASSTDFPVTPGAYQVENKASSGNQTGFVTKLNATGTALVYSTYLGGSVAESLSLWNYVDHEGHVYLTGTTSSYDFPTTPGAFQTSAPGLGPNLYAIVVTKLNIAGSGLVFSTFLGSASSSNFGGGVAADDEGNVYVAGSVSAKFPTTKGAFQSVNKTNGGITGFVTKLNPSGSALLYSTYLGGSADSSAGSPALDSLGNVYVTGQTAATDFPVTSDAFQKTNMGSTAYSYLNCIFTELNASGSALVYSSYLGGVYSSCGPLALDGLNNVYVAGFAQGNFPTTPGAFQEQGGGGFVSKFALNGVTSTTLTSNANPQVLGEPVTLTARVTSASGGGIPSGIVGFVEKGKVFAHEFLDNAGSASYTTSNLSPGEHTIVASYEGRWATFEGAPTTYSSSNGVLNQVITGGQVATPTFPVLGGTYGISIKVTIETPTAGATIHYTTDGAMPTSSSPTYTGPFKISGTTTVKAIATLTGDTPSAVASATYTLVSGVSSTATTIASSANPSTLTEAVLFTATVVSLGAGGPTPTGSVSFKDGAVVVGTAPLVDGVARFTTSGLSLYGHAIAAIYTGSETYLSSGASITQEVQ